MCEELIQRCKRVSLIEICDCFKVEVCCNVGYQLTIRGFVFGSMYDSYLKLNFILGNIDPIKIVKIY